MVPTYTSVVICMLVALIFFIVGAVYGHWIETQALMRDCLTTETLRLDGRAFICFETHL